MHVQEVLAFHSTPILRKCVNLANQWLTLLCIKPNVSTKKQQYKCHWTELKKKKQ